MTHLVFLIAAVLAAPAGQGATAPSVTPAVETEVRSALAKRVAAMTNVRIDYELTDNFPLNARDLKSVVSRDGQRVYVHSNGMYRYVERAFAVEGRTRLDSQLLDHQSLVLEPHLLRPVQRTFVFTPDHAQKLELYGLIPGDWRSARGWVRHSAGLQPSILETALGMRALPDSTSRLTDANYHAMKIVAAGPGQVRLVAQDDFWIITWTLDARHDYAPVAYSARWRNGNYLVAQAALSDYRQVGGLELPFTITSNALRPQINGKMRVTATELVTIKQYQFNSPANNPDFYWIDWPEGTPVRDDSANQDLVARHGVLKP